MPTNVYFSTGTTSEQRLYEDLIIEQLKIYGQDVFYLPRKIANKDTIFGEDPASSFDDSYIIEMYVNNTTNGATTISNALADTNCLLNIGKGNVGGQYMNGYVSEFGVYNKALSSTQQERLTQYLSFKYAITI